MLLHLLILLISLSVLLLAADRFVEAVVEVAKRYDIPEMVIGLTVVAIGTSLPEAAASAAAALSGHPEIALGNVIGSNVANVGLILGLPALIAPIVSGHRAAMLRQGALMLTCTLLLFGLAFFAGEISRPVGIMMLVSFAAFIWLSFHKGGVADQLEDEDEGEDWETVAEEALTLSTEDVEVRVPEKREEPTWKLCLYIVLSLVFVLLSSEFLVNSTVDLARAVGISENVIAISIIALGTSLPELSVSLAAVRRKEGDILIGNVLGSNVSNILLVLGVGASIRPLSISSISINLDIPLMMVFALLMLLFLSQEKGITAKKGAFLLLLYLGVIARCVIMPH